MLKVHENNWVDRVSAAFEMKQALIKTAGPTDGLSQSILDVVCSQTTTDGKPNAAGASKVNSVFYMRFPAFLGYLAQDQWVPKINRMRICGMPVQAYLLFGLSKEPLRGQGNQNCWDVTVDGIQPSAAQMEPGRVKEMCYNPQLQGL